MPDVLIRCGKHLVPPGFRPALRNMRRLTYVGSRVECPCCGRAFRTFAPFGASERPNAECLSCGSLERHRLQWLYLRDWTDVLHTSKRVLHIAPEVSIRRWLEACENLVYVTGDLVSRDVDVQLDVQELPFATGTFDVVICNHVLEHVDDDRAALRELYRVLKPGGWAILQSALDPTLDRTLEDPSIVTPEERRERFGQDDHCRLYSRDYVERVRTAGFDVTVVDWRSRVGEERSQRHGLDSREELYLCSRPTRESREYVHVHDQ